MKEIEGWGSFTFHPFTTLLGTHPLTTLVKPITESNALRTARTRRPPHGSQKIRATMLSAVGTPPALT